MGNNIPNEYHELFRILLLCIIPLFMIALCVVMLIMIKRTPIEELKRFFRFLGYQHTESKRPFYVAVFSCLVFCLLLFLLFIMGVFKGR